MATIDTAVVVTRILEALAGPIVNAGAVMEVGPLPAVWSDAGHLESLLTNLISNAVKFRSPDGPVQVRVSATEQDGWVTLAVDDNGIGVEPEYRERVFRMFQRLHVREAYAGTGIGLAIAQQIVELHNGRIWIEDSDLGGAGFRCTLPTTAQPPADHA